MKVLLVRAESTPDDDARALADCGLDVTADAYIHVAALRDDGALDRASALLAALESPDTWLIVTSAAALRALDCILGSAAVTASLRDAVARGARFAAVGPASAQSLTDHAVHEILLPARAHTAAALLESLAGESPARAVLPRSSIADPIIARTLESRGWGVLSLPVYETTTVITRPLSAAAIAAGAFDAIVLRSPSAARAVAHFTAVPASTAIIAGGPTTALAAERLGFHVSAVSADSRASSIVAAIVAALQPIPVAH